MEKGLLREKLHPLIDEVDDEIMLENLLTALHGFQRGRKADFLDELSEQQLADLRKAQEQVRNGQVIRHDDMKTIIHSWFTK